MLEELPRIIGENVIGMNVFKNIVRLALLTLPYYKCIDFLAKQSCDSEIVDTVVKFCLFKT